MLAAFGGAGCASNRAPAANAQWRTVKSVPGCIGSDSQWDLPDQVSIRLQPDLQSMLMKQLGQQPLEHPLCWYRIRNGDLLLRAGSFCDLSQEAQFSHDGSRWALVRIEHVLGECGTNG